MSGLLLGGLALGGLWLWARKRAGLIPTDISPEAGPITLAGPAPVFTFRTVEAYFPRESLEQARLAGTYGRYQQQAIMGQIAWMEDPTTRVQAYVEAIRAGMIGIQGQTAEAYIAQVKRGPEWYATWLEGQRRAYGAYRPGGMLSRGALS